MDMGDLVQSFYSHFRKLTLLRQFPILFTHGMYGMLSPTLCFCVTFVKWMVVFPVWLRVLNLSPLRRGTTEKGMDAEL